MPSAKASCFNEAVGAALSYSDQPASAAAFSGTVSPVSCDRRVLVKENQVALAGQSSEGTGSLKNWIILLKNNAKYPVKSA
mmetsp:Transcript_76811/g.207118  ORF Transcript_76811/g.207118 Transcript_76811/m.207118 type:complete len:81 (+) Transcript_76811:762-1004(+)